MTTPPADAPCNAAQEADDVKTNSFSDAGSPFDDEDADVIVRSCDLVDFFLYRTILAKASAGFAEILESAQPDGVFRNGLYIIRATEDAKTLSALFRLIYPVDNPALTKLSEIKSVFKAMKKYRVRGLDKTADGILQAAASKAPEVVYAIACGYQMPGAARVAARHSLYRLSRYLPLTDEEVSMMTALQYSRLLRYQSACRDVAVSVIESFIVETASKSNIPCVTLAEASNGARLSTGCQCAPRGYQAGGKLIRGPEWFFTYMAGCRAALNDSPVGSVVGSAALRLSSSTPCAACPACCKVRRCEFMTFTQAFGVAIDRAVGMVLLEI